MCPRPQRFRRMHNLPLFKGFEPINAQNGSQESVILNFDEYEAIKLCDYEGLKQEEAALRMNVSRPTLTRIYERARKKIAIAIAEVRPIHIEGGQVSPTNNWFKCEKCGSLFNNPVDETVEKCALCNSQDIILIKGNQNLGTLTQRKHRNYHNRTF